MESREKVWAMPSKVERDVDIRFITEVAGWVNEWVIEWEEEINLYDGIRHCPPGHFLCIINTRQLPQGTVRRAVIKLQIIYTVKKNTYNFYTLKCLVSSSVQFIFISGKFIWFWVTMILTMILKMILMILIMITMIFNNVWYAVKTQQSLYIPNGMYQSATWPIT